MNFNYTRAYLRAWLLHFFSCHEMAIEAYQLAFQANRKSVRAARNLAEIAAEKKDMAVSEKWFEIVIELDPGDASAWFNLGFVRDAAGKNHEAIAAFQESIARLPTLDLAWYGMGLSYAAIGNHTEAAKALSEAVKLQPMNGISYYQLGMAYYYLNDSENLESTISMLTSFDPKHAKRLIHDSERADLIYLLPQSLH